MERKQKKKSVFDRFIIWLLAVLQRSFIGRFFTSYDKANEKFEKKIKAGRYSSEKRFARFIERNRVLNFIPKIFQFLLRIPLRDYGIMLFMTGAVVAVLYPLNDMILFINVNFKMFVIGAGTCVCAIPLFFSSRSFASNVLSSKMFRFILFNFLGLDEEGFRIADEKGRVSFATFSFLIGAGLGVASYFLLPVNTVILVLGIFLAYCTVRTPEVGVVVTILLIPFLNINITCIFIAYTFLCYVMKVFLGKRILKFQYFDLWVSIAIFVLTVSGINFKDPLSSLNGTALNLIILLSYFLFSNLIYSKEWFRRSMVAFTTSSMVVAIVAITQGVLRKLAKSIEDLEPVFSQHGEIASTFDSPSVLAEFMVIAVPFAFVHMISERKESSKFAGFVLAALLITALVLTDSALGIVGLLVGVLFTLAFFNRNVIYLIVTVAVALPVLYFTLPENIMEKVFTIGPLNGASIEGELIYFKDNFLSVIKKPFGIGIGSEGMVETFGYEYIDSLPLQLIATHGILGTVVFVLMIVMFARVILSYSVKAKNEYRRVNGCAGLCSIIALLSVGIFSYVWADKRVFLLFVMTMALSFAYIKIDKEEEAVAVKYVDITRATVDIPLKETVAYKALPQRRYLYASKISKRLKKQEKNKTAEAKEFSNTEELIVVRKKYEEEFKEIETVEEQD